MMNINQPVDIGVMMPNRQNPNRYSLNADIEQPQQPLPAIAVGWYWMPAPVIRPQPARDLDPNLLRERPHNRRRLRN